MPQDKTNLEIVTELAEEMAGKSETSCTPETDSKSHAVQDTDLPSSPRQPEKSKKSAPVPNKEKPTLKDIAIKRKNQNLEERKTLLKILALLLGIQLIFMNAVVSLIVYWCVFDRKVFHELDANVLACIFDFTKFYVTAVLVELLGGIVYIVHSVFSDKG